MIHTGAVVVRQDDDLRILELGGGRMRMYKSGGQLCQYVLETADQMDAAVQDWNWTTRPTHSSTNGEIVLPAFTASNLMMRVKVIVPE